MNERDREWYERMERMRREAEKRIGTKRKEREREEARFVDHSDRRPITVDDDDDDVPPPPQDDSDFGDELPDDIPPPPQDEDDEGFVDDPNDYDFEDELPVRVPTPPAQNDVDDEDVVASVDNGRRPTPPPQDEDVVASVNNGRNRALQAYADAANQMQNMPLVMHDEAGNARDNNDVVQGKDFLERVIKSSRLYNAATDSIDLNKVKEVLDKLDADMRQDYVNVSVTFASEKLGNLIQQDPVDLIRYIRWKLTNPYYTLEHDANARQDPRYLAMKRSFDDHEDTSILAERFRQISEIVKVNYDNHRGLNCLVIENTPIMFSFLFVVLLMDLLDESRNKEFNPSVLLWKGITQEVPLGTADNVTNSVIRVNLDGTVSMRHLMNVITQLWKHVKQILSFGPLYTLDETPESGVTVFVEQNEVVSILIYLREVMSSVPAQKFYGGMKAIVENKFPHKGLAIPENETDNYCLFYCVCMGYVKLMYNNMYSCGRSMFIDVNMIKRNVTNMIGVNEMASRIMRQYIESQGENRSELAKFMDQEEARKSMSCKECVEFYKKVEKELVPAGNIALDIFSCNMRHTNPKIFPIFISKKITGQRIQLLSMDFGRVCHFGLILNKRSIFEQTGGAIFEVCSKCHQSFFTRESYLKHITNSICKDIDETQMCNWNNIDARSLDDGSSLVGSCQKCHLIFDSEFCLEHHIKNCFMRNRRGTKYVKLCDGEDPLLTGEENPYEFLPDKYILFADFECIIKPSGEHEFLSYGLYDCQKRSIDLGYDMLTFMTKLEDIASERGHKEIYVYFHNAMNYDVNFILKYVLENYEQYKKWSIKVMMKSSSSLQSVKLRFYHGDVKNLRTIIIGDTYKFMSMSLEKIVDSMKGESLVENRKIFPRFFEIFRLMKRHHVPVGDWEINMVLQKNLLPYKFFDDKEKLKTPMEDFAKIFEPREENLQYFGKGVTLAKLTENKSLFDKICHYFDLNDRACQYYELYLKCDVMQLADIFMKIRESVFETHKIDLCDYIGSPSATWHAWLRANPDLKIHLYRDTFHAEFFASMTRGGVTSAPLRYAESDDTHSILYFDVNGLYPYVMQKYGYPMGDFRTHIWNIEDNCEEWLRRYFEQLEREGKGAGLCVDLTIPKELHIKFDQYPPAPEHRILKDCFLDPDGQIYEFMKKWSEANDGEPIASFKGLVCTLYDKKEYAVNWKLLEWYINHGVKVTRIHYSIDFTLGYYLRDYVLKNIELRNKCHDPLMKLFWKLFGNALYGKTFESPFNKKKFLIIRNRDKLQGVLTKGNVSRIIPIDENNSIIELDGEDVLMKYPTSIGANVTEYAKLVMYELFYDKLMSVFPDMKLVYTDTDSFIISFPHERGVTVQQIFDKIDEVAPNVIGGLGGQIKSETGQDRIKKCVALRSKLYTYITEGGEVCKKAKGVPKANIENELSFEDYTENLIHLVDVYSQDIELFKRTAFGITSEKFIKKIISANDGKRKIEPDGIHTHAWGYNP
ncbi:MAG: hypothetical protein J6V44_00105 [Methanobrevibacter sp.]|nr:hypothetical protein [Methanobrevibacter sp.]